MKIEFVRATEADAAELVKVQDQSFLEDYLKYGQCPGYGRSVESMKASMQKNTQFKIIADGQIIGKVSGHVADNHAHLDCLCVIPEFQHKGIGQRAVSFMESQFPGVYCWSLKTPKDKLRNVTFYQKCGYIIEDEMQDGLVTVVLLKKYSN